MPIAFCNILHGETIKTPLSFIKYDDINTELR